MNNPHIGHASEEVGFPTRYRRSCYRPRPCGWLRPELRGRCLAESSTIFTKAIQDPTKAVQIQSHRGFRTKERRGERDRRGEESWNERVALDPVIITDFSPLQIHSLLLDRSSAITVDTNTAEEERLCCYNFHFSFSSGCQVVGFKWMKSLDQIWVAGAPVTHECYSWMSCRWDALK
ncbi:hypothetical protein PROFUN_03537 [Planoprotostelium fungivorum]|uniref:Uncharacterized protein n=1 Tax=Planoprotostelium fungivorum TaxID=1890364 RepID=A0A2P6MSE3_9EUKA|nr:hypothetical protein PROFUN_03537 [Planoprotostelium fungivorum]